jgi:hypothetical protein
LSPFFRDSLPTCTDITIENVGLNTWSSFYVPTALGAGMTSAVTPDYPAYFFLSPVSFSEEGKMEDILVEIIDPTQLVDHTFAKSYEDSGFLYYYDQIVRGGCSGVNMTLWVDEKEITTFTGFYNPSSFGSYPWVKIDEQEGWVYASKVPGVTSQLCPQVKFPFIRFLSPAFYIL